MRNKFRNVFGLGTVIRVMRPRYKNYNLVKIGMAVKDAKMAEDYTCYLCNYGFYLYPYYRQQDLYQLEEAKGRIRDIHLCEPRLSCEVLFGEMSLSPVSKIIKFDHEFEYQTQSLLEQFLVRSLAHSELSLEANHISGSDPQVFLGITSIGCISEIVGRYESMYQNSVVKIGEDI